MGTTYRASFNANISNPASAGSRSFIKPPSSFYVFQPRPAVPSTFQNAEFDGKRLRKAVARKTVDYNTSVVKMLEARVWQRDFRDQRAIQPDLGYYTQMMPPMYMTDNPANCITTKFVRTSTNKMRCPIFCVLWTPEGRRLVTGASSGEFTLWNGLTFNFETILQAHDSAVKVMVWSHSDSWMVTADQSGYVKYWQSNMNNVKMFQAHKEAVRAISFCPTDTKFATCSDDGTVRIWDFMRCLEERILRGHGADVKGVDWHPTKALIASGSKDSQQPVKLWDPKTGQSLATLHAHKNTVTDVKWNQNGNWLLTSSRDHLIKIFDIRNMSCEMQTFRGHKREVSTLAWHPIQEGLFASGGSDGSILFWLVGTEKEIGCMEQAHDSIVWSLSWHPLGHILTSGSNDHSCKFWTRNRPGDRMRDKYNLNLLPKESEEIEFEEDTSVPIPGIGQADRNNQQEEEESFIIPGFGFDRSEEEPVEVGTGGRPPVTNHHSKERKVPYSKPVPKQFQQQWNSESSNRQVNNRREDSYHQQAAKYDNDYPQPYAEGFNYNENQPFANSPHANQEFYGNQFGGQPGPQQPPPSFFNGNGAPPAPFQGNIHPPTFNEFNQKPPPIGDNNEKTAGPNFFPNQVSGPIESFGSGQTSSPQFLPPTPLPPQMFGGNHFDMGFPLESGQSQAQPANYNEYHNDNDQRQFYEQPGYPPSKRIRG